MTMHTRSGLACVSGHTFVADPLGEDSLVVDLGGAAGDFAETVNSWAGCRCHVVEAAPENVALIRETALVTKHHYAVGGVDGTARFAIAGQDSFHWGSVTALGDVPFTGEIEVPAITLDSLLRRVGADRVDLLKVDIEGAELAMFDTAGDDTLRRVAQITVEFHDFLDPAFKPAIERIKRRLAGLGFKVLVLTRRHHGDVLFVNQALVPVPAWRWWYWSVVVRYGRGLRRIAGRMFQSAA
ncbi:FkbM family methyltransferase [Magnetospirillum aberrantis SpK]|uniref:FkbM family methyltransferase n=2 Tax=Magnetospirillum TaxID=13134 RepID=A0A7C9V0V3_9PROT|nr:FkbM family methyltransferase [Magnetospirillum aberrantis SpK]